MSRATRVAAWALVAAGVLLGLNTGVTPPGAPPRHGDAFVLAVDFHVHSLPGAGAPALGSSWTDPASAMCVWVGLVVLVVIGFPETEGTEGTAFTRRNVETEN